MAICFAVAAAGLGGIQQNAQSAVIYWDGGDGSNSNWSDTNNWSSSATAGSNNDTRNVPTSADDVVFYRAGGARLLTGVVNSDFTISSLTFGNGQTGNVVLNDSTGDVLTINGRANYNPLTYTSGASANLGTVGIFVQSGMGSVTIDAPITLGGSQQWINNSSNTLTVTGALGNGTNVLTIAGSGNTTLSGTMSGTGGLVKNDAGTLLLSGTSASTSVTVNAGTLRLGASNRLANSATVSVGNAAILDMQNFSDTIGTFNLSGTASLNGSGTLTASNYNLSGGTINADLGAGTMTVATGTTVLNGTADASPINITSGALQLGASNLFTTNSAVVTVSGTGILNMQNFSDTIGDFNMSGGSLNGTGTLTAATYDLSGGTVNANLGAGTLTVTTGTAVLNGQAAATTVNISSGTLQLGAADRLANTANVTVSGTGTLNLQAFTDTVGTFAMSGGTLNAANATLTAATYNLTGGTVNAKLGAGIVNVSSGTVTLGSAGRLNGASILNLNSGTLNLAGSETVADFNMAGGTLGTAGQTLTAATYDLAGGTIHANLGAGTLNIIGGSTLLNGSEAATSVNIKNGTLQTGNTNVLASNAAVTFGAARAAGILDLAGKNQQVASLVMAGGSAATALGTVTAFTGSQVNSTATVTFASLPAGLSVGQAVMSPNLNLGTTIQSINGNTVVLQTNVPAVNAAAVWNGGSAPVNETFNFGAWSTNSASQVIGNSSTTANAVLTVAGPATSTFGGSIQNTIGSGNKTTGLTVTGGTLILNGRTSNTFSGGTTITAGTVVANAVQGTNPLGTGSVTLSGGTLSLKAQGTQGTISATGYTHDTIAEVGATAGTNWGTAVPFDAPANSTGGANLYVTGFKGSRSVFQPAFPQGLPVNGTINSASNNLVTFQMQSYTAANTLFMQTSSPTGGLTLSTPARFSTLNFLSTASAGTSNVGFTLNFADGSTETGVFTSPDWAQSGTTNAAYYAAGRFDRGTGSYDSTWSPYMGLYEYDYNISVANQGKVLNSISFLDIGGQSTPSYVGIFAISGTAINTGGTQTYNNAVTVTANSTIDIANQLNASVGTLAIGSQTLSVTSSDASLAAYGLTTGAATLSGNPTFNVANNGGLGTLTLGALNDSGVARTITKTNAGALTLNAAAASLVNGTALNISAGSVNSNQATALGTLANVSIADSATLRIGASQTLGAINNLGTPSLNNASVVLNSNTLTVGNTNNLPSTFAGVISGSGNLVKAGTNTMTLAGASTYSGTTTVNAGRFYLTGSLGNTAIAVNNANTIFQPGVAATTGSTGAGTLGSTLALNAGTLFDMASDNTLSTFNVRQQNSFAGNALTLNNATLNFNLSNIGADLLSVNKPASISGTNTINITTLGSSLTPGSTYNLITATSGMTGTFRFANGLTSQNVVVGGTRYTLSLVNSNTFEAITTALEVAPAISLSAGGATQIIAGSTHGAVSGSVTNPNAGSNYVIPAGGITSIGSGTVAGITPNSGSVAPNGSLNYTGTVNASTFVAGNSYNLQTRSTDSGSPAAVATSNVITVQAVNPSLGSVQVVGGSTNFGSVIKGATVTPLTFNLANAAGNRAALEVQSASGSGSASTLSGGPAYNYLVAAGSNGSPNYSLAINTNTTGAYSTTQTFTTADDQSVLGHSNFAPNLAVTVTGTVYDHASINTFNGGTIVLPSVIVGYSPVGPVSGLNVTNGTAGDLRVNLQAASASQNNVTVNGFGNVTAGNSGTLTANLAAGRGVGVINETLTVTLGDDSALNGAVANLYTRNVTVTGSVLDHAAGQVNTATIQLPILHVGYAGPVAGSNTITVSNQLGIRVPLKTFGGDASANGITLSGNVSGLITGGAGATIGATLAAGQGVGQINQNFTLTYADDSALNGASNNVGTQNIQVVGQVNYYAQPVIQKTSGTGSFTVTNPQLYTLDFGPLASGTGLYTGNLNILNSFLSTFQDSLGGSFTVSGVTHFGLTGFSNFSGILSGQNLANLGVSFNTNTLASGVYTDTLVFNPLSTNASGTSALTPIILQLTGSISASNQTLVYEDNPASVITVDGNDTVGPPPPPSVARTFVVSPDDVGNKVLKGISISINFDKLTDVPNIPGYPYADLYAFHNAALSDIHLKLTNPDGLTVELIRGDHLNRGGNPFDGTLYFSDTATNSIGVGSTLLIDGQYYIPTGTGLPGSTTFEDFFAGSVAGVWTLTIEDIASFDPLNYYGATLSLTIGSPTAAQVPEPATLSVLGAGAMMLLARRSSRRSEKATQEYHA